jgi:hydroxyacylglutathione hydrolase
MEFPGETIVYAGHDYVEEYMEFAKQLEPDNTHIERFLGKYDPAHVYSTLDEEFKINPFLRFNDKKIISILQKRDLPVGTEYERWESLMSLM